MGDLNYINCAASVSFAESDEKAAARAEFERQHEGRDLSRHHLRGTYVSGPIAALWNQHLRTIEWLRRAVPQDNAEQDASQWTPVNGPGQVKKGDKLRFTIGDKSYKETARLILHPGTDKEEVIYNKYQNFYFITAGIGSFSNHKNVEFLAASNATSPADAAKGE